MIDAQKLLDQFLGTGGGAQQGAGTPANPRQTSGGSIQDQIGGFLGGQGNSALKGALAGGLATYLLGSKRGRKLGGKAVKYGGMALVAGLAYKAWQNHQAKSAGELPPQQQPQQHPQIAHQPAQELPSPEGTAFAPDGHEAEDRARLILSAMIAAAKADGYIDQDEQEAIYGRIEALDLDSEDKGLLFDEMRRPLSIDDLVERTPNQEVATEVYAASLLAIDPDHPAERAYLDMLAARLGLPEALTHEVRRATDEVQEDGVPA
ncbi:tellurite resistance TerB family protein [Afifella sp. YEN Y35]|uniref:tellurite resistance TerB family protein n=1 Tax=Afifella sp. YEN Y35 TaxID=3388337 RepID=UPI0039E03896